MESQVAPELEGKVLKKFHKWTIEKTNAGICISDGWVTHWITCYGNGKWAADTEIQHAGIKSWLNKNCDKL